MLISGLNYLERTDWVSRYQSSFSYLARRALNDLPEARTWNEERREYLRVHRSRLRWPQVLIRIESESLVKSLQSFRGRISPLLKLPEILGLPIHAPATEFLNAFFKDSPWNALVERILKKCRRMEGDFRYRTESGQVIVGHDGSDLRSLSGFAHELGHCFFEALFPSARKIEFYSELFARRFENRIVESFLAQTSQASISLSQWREYQAQVDQLYFALCTLESYEARGMDASAEIGFVFDPALLLLSQTLFTKPGYQSLYAEVAQRRINYSRSDRASPDR